jgi:hypothetical protein
MRRIQGIDPHVLWIGTVENVRGLEEVVAAGASALVDVAGVDTTVTIPAGFQYCRFALADGPGNPPWLLRAAISTAARFLAEQRPTVVACRHGMSRSVVVASGALAFVRGAGPDSCLEEVKRDASTMVDPGLWRDVKAALEEFRAAWDQVHWGTTNPFRDARLDRLPFLIREFRAGRLPAEWRGNQVWENRWQDLPMKPPGYYREFYLATVAGPVAVRVVLGQEGEVFVSGKNNRHWQQVLGLPSL